MAIFRAGFQVVDSHLIGDQEYSVNFHITDSVSSASALAAATAIAEMFATHLLPNWCRVVRVFISNPDVVNGNQSDAVDMVGVRGSTGASLPGWNTIKFQARSLATGRPSTFHFRIGLAEDDVNGQQIESNVVDSLDDFITALGTQNKMCNPAGSPFAFYSYSGVVANRQMGWRRRTRPGYHRGWVPNT